MTAQAARKLSTEPKLGVGVILCACSWTAVLLFINRGLFRNRLIETGDQATILFQVRNAQLFHELLGNYSRWLFHHPGPAFFYILALGDLLFRRWLPLCPQPMNSVYLTLLLLNVVLLFTSIWILARHSRSTLFLPVAVLLCLWTVYVINRTYGPVATTDVWMPYAVLFVFLLFSVTCATVASGEARDLPLMVICAGLLAHAHVAQLLFVAVLCAAALALLYWNLGHNSLLKNFFRGNQRILIASGALLVLFITPILIESATGHPNNPQKIRTYLAEHRGEHNPLLDAIKYQITFFTFTQSPETSVGNSDLPRLLGNAARNGYVLCYWIMAFALALAAMILWPRASPDARRFCLYLIGEALLISLLFLYWARRITGPLYAFNGHFYFAVQFLVLMALAAVALDGLPLRVPRRYSFALACALPLLMSAAPLRFNRIGSNPVTISDPWFADAAQDTLRIAAGIPHQPSRIRIQAPGGVEGLLRVTGVASRLHWADQPLCVDEKWVFLFEDRDRCEHVADLIDLEMTPGTQTDSPWEAQLRPFPASRLPIAIGPAVGNSLTVRSYGPEAYRHSTIWVTRRLAIRFLLAADWNGTPKVRIFVKGAAIAGRPSQVLLNGELIGQIGGSGPVTGDFVVSASQFRAGGENEIAFAAAPGGRTGRRENPNLAFDVASVQFQPISLAAR